MIDIQNLKEKKHTYPKFTLSFKYSSQSSQISDKN